MTSRLIRRMAVAMSLLCSVPGFAAAEPNPALNNPDKQNWELFLHVVAGVTHQPTAPGAFFETWASDTDTFQAVPAWPDATKPRLRSIRPPALAAASKFAVQRNAAPGGTAPPSAGASIVCPPPANPAPPPATQNFCTAAGTLVEDVFRNFASFNFIVQNDLYQVPGLVKAYAKVAATGNDIAFPIDAIEVKTNWLPLAQLQNYLGPNVPARPETYHQRIIPAASGGDGQVYVLLSMHIMSKLVPNWTWATFEHQDNPGRCNIVGCRDSFGAEQALVPATSSADPDQTHYAKCAKSAALTAMFSAVPHDPAFESYCLKGSMADFTDQSGRSFVVGNSVTEQGFVSSSSCMGCHGIAATNSAGGSPNGNGNLPFFFSASTLTNTAPPLGPIDPILFWTNAPPNGQNTLPMVADQNQNKFPAQPESSAVKTEPRSPLTRIAIPVDFVWSVPFCAYNPVSKTAPCAGK